MSHKNTLGSPHNLVLLRPCLKMNLFRFVFLFCTFLLVCLASLPSALDNIFDIVVIAYKPEDGVQNLFHFWKWKLCTHFFSSFWSCLLELSFSTCCAVSSSVGFWHMKEALIILIEPVTNFTWVKLQTVHANLYNVQKK